MQADGANGGSAHRNIERAGRKLEHMAATFRRQSGECGAILGISPHTVRCYLESARHKLGASSNTHAVSIALKRGLLFQLP